MREIDWNSPTLEGDLKIVFNPSWGLFEGVSAYSEIFGAAKITVYACSRREAVEELVQTLRTIENNGEPE